MSEAFIKAEMALFLAQAKEVDIIITTALIPGKPAPKLITREMVEAMKPGSVVVDLAAATGGNCELTEKGKLVTTENGVRIIGYTDLPGRLPGQSSELYGNNLASLMKLLAPQKNGQIELNFEDPIIRNMTVVKVGEITFPPPPISVSAAPKKAPAAAPAPVAAAPKAMSPQLKYGLLGVGAVLLGWLGQSAPADFLVNLTVFVLACIVGYYVIWNVTHSLHTPLLSVTNAISSIIIVGALLQIGQGGLVTFLAFVAVLIAFINIFGGFAVTHRILQMFRKE
jgi:NAD(P) transhydrogenase subunit alpha